MYVAVKFVEDEEVYRAKTITNDSDNPEVLYVDYGNSVSTEHRCLVHLLPQFHQSPNEEVVPRDNVYQLENYLAKVLPCQAIRCALDNVDSIKDDMGEIKQELVDKFAELICEKEVQVMNITQASRDDPHNKVEMLVDGNNVLTILQQEFASLNGPPEIASCPVTMGTVVKGVIVGEFQRSGQTFWVQMAGKIGAVDSKLKACNSDKCCASRSLSETLTWPRTNSWLTLCWLLTSSSHCSRRTGRTSDLFTSRVPWAKCRGSTRCHAFFLWRISRFLAI
eukprot:sb/3467938/